MGVNTLVLGSEAADNFLRGTVTRKRYGPWCQYIHLVAGGGGSEREGGKGGGSTRTNCSIGSWFEL